MNVSARQIQETCQKQNVDLYLTFVDQELTEVFDTVRHIGLQKSCPSLAMHPDSWQFMVACRLMFRMVERSLNHFMW